MGEQTPGLARSQEGGAHLRLLKPQGEAVPAPIKRRRMRIPGRGLPAVAAILFLVVMVGSLLAIVHLTRQAPTGPNLAGSTSTTQPGQWTPIPGYPYPTPGSTTSISPASSDGFSTLTWSPDSQQVATSTQGKVWIWGATSSAPPFVFDPQAGSGPVVLAWSPGAPRLAVGSNQAQVIDPGNGVVKFSYPALASNLVGNGAARVTALAWSPDGMLLAVAGHDPVAGNEVSIWDVNKGGQPLYTFTGQRAGDAISSLSWSSDGRYVASANGQSVQAWDAHHGTVIFQHALTAPTDVVWSPGASNAGDLAFVSNGSTQVWYVWNLLPAGSLVSSYPDTPNGALSWSPDGHYLATASGRNVIIYNATTGVHLYTYSGNTHDVHALAWSPDGNSIASGESGPAGLNYVRIWSA
jgi:WD40 repeat protein